MIKTLVTAAAVSAAITPAAFAGVYINHEVNSGFWGSDYQGSVLDVHVGWEGKPSENSSVYIQAGPAIIAAQGADSTTEFSGKGGFGFDLSEKLSAYGEVSFLTVEDFDNNYNTKAGLKWSF